MNNLLFEIAFEPDRKNLLSFLDKLENHLFEPNINLLEFVNDNLGHILGQHFLNLIEDKSDVQTILLLVKKLRDTLKNMKKVRLTINFEPDKNTVDKVRQFISSVDNPVIIEFVKDNSIIGGCVLENNGYIFEYSFRDYFEKREKDKLKSNFHKGV